MRSNPHSKRKSKSIEPITFDELRDAAGMSGFVSFLNVSPAELPSTGVATAWAAAAVVDTTRVGLTPDDTTRVDTTPFDDTTEAISAAATAVDTSPVDIGVVEDGSRDQFHPPVSNDGESIVVDTTPDDTTLVVTTEGPHSMGTTSNRVDMAPVDTPCGGGSPYQAITPSTSTTHLPPVDTTGVVHPLSNTDAADWPPDTSRLGTTPVDTTSVVSSGVVTTAVLSSGDLANKPDTTPVNTTLVVDKRLTVAHDVSNGESIAVDTTPVDQSGVDHAATAPAVATPVVTRRPAADLLYAPVKGGKNLHRCSTAQDGHSHLEEALYQLLWTTGTVVSADVRIAQASQSDLARHLRITDKNLRIALERLVEKQSIAEVAAPDFALKLPRRYEVYSCPTILERRRAAGLEWVIRNKGVQFASRGDIEKYRKAAIRGLTITTGVDVS